MSIKRNQGLPIDIGQEKRRLRRLYGDVIEILIFGNESDRG